MAQAKCHLKSQPSSSSQVIPELDSPRVNRILDYDTILARRPAVLEESDRSASSARR
jgi:hypothetical protein